jgi:hypothetical protein
MNREMEDVRSDMKEPTDEVIVALEPESDQPEAEDGSDPLEEEEGLLPYVEEEAANLAENVLATIPDPYGTKASLTWANNVNLDLAGTILRKAGKQFAAPEGEDDGGMDYDQHDLTLSPISPLTGSPSSLTFVPPVPDVSAADTVLFASLDKELSTVEELQMDNFQWALLLAHMQLRKMARIRTCQVLRGIFDLQGL